MTCSSGKAFAIFVVVVYLILSSIAHKKVCFVVISDSMLWECGSPSLCSAGDAAQLSSGEEPFKCMVEDMWGVNDDLAC